MKHWFKRKDEMPEPKPPTRAAVLFQLFYEWGGEPFSHSGLVGIGETCRRMNGFSRESCGHADVRSANAVILRLEKGYPYSEHYITRAVIYDEQYSEQLDGYIIALKEAIQTRHEAACLRNREERAKRTKEETQF